MMGPHWNPRATEIAVVLQGQGMVQMVCPSDPKGKVDDDFACRNTKFKVEEGDAFVVPRFHPMTQVSYNNDTFVFVGFSSMAGNNHPQFLAGRSSVLQALDPDVVAASFNAPNASTIEGFLKVMDSSPEVDLIIIIIKTRRSKPPTSCKDRFMALQRSTIPLANG
ncbi:hypothetical protein BHM03_00058661 [Ensete ventricosum]|nr:hypothetical protein BHM03_00058661 [Ensete ventricosum]